MKRIKSLLSRRRFLGTSAAGSALLVPSWNASARGVASKPITAHVDPDGPSVPFPIPWLDMNGNHNQPAGPDLEPSHIYHFKGRVARCSGFNGAGANGKGERILVRHQDDRLRHHGW